MYALDLDVFVQVHHTINEEPLARERGDLCGWYELDFTHPTCSRHSVLNQRVVHQVCMFSSQLAGVLDARADQPWSGHHQGRSSQHAALALHW